MIHNYSATSDIKGRHRIQNYSQRLLSPVVGLGSKESSLVNLYLNDLNKHQKSFTIVNTR